MHDDFCSYHKTQSFSKGAQLIYNLPEEKRSTSDATHWGWSVEQIYRESKSWGGGGGTWPLLGYRGAAEGLKSWPCLGQKYSKNATLCKGQQPSFQGPVLDKWQSTGTHCLVLQEFKLFNKPFKSEKSGSMILKPSCCVSPLELNTINDLIAIKVQTCYPLLSARCLALNYPSVKLKRLQGIALFHRRPLTYGTVCPFISALWTILNVLNLCLRRIFSN